MRGGKSDFASPYIDLHRHSTREFGWKRPPRAGRLGRMFPSLSAAARYYNFTAGKNMAASVEQSPVMNLRGLDAISSSIAELRQQAEAFAGFVTEQLTSLETRHTALEEREAQLRQRIEETSGRKSELEEERQKLEAERLSLRENADSSEAKWQEREAELQGQLEKMHQELQQARDELAELHSSPQDNPTGDSNLPEWEEERLELESELELVRTRAAELNEELEEQRRQLASEREEASKELGQMKRVLEQQATLLAEKEEMASTRDTVPNAGSADDGRQGAPAADPILGSVMAQFEMLQRDAVRRRAKHRAQA